MDHCSDQKLACNPRKVARKLLVEHAMLSFAIGFALGVVSVYAFNSSKTEKHFKRRELPAQHGILKHGFDLALCPNTLSES
jgi:hypothetical protein